MPFWPHHIAVHADGDEGVVAWGGLPLIAADLIRLQQLRPLAEQAAKPSGVNDQARPLHYQAEIDAITPR